MSWLSRVQSRPSDSFSSPSEGQEEMVKAALLEKALKGRQPTDLMLRCEQRSPTSVRLQESHFSYRYNS